MIPQDRIIDRMVKGLGLLRHEKVIRTQLDHVPESFPNGVAKQPSRHYIVVELAEPVLPTYAQYLREIGWTSEQDGYFWCFYH